MKKFALLYLFCSLFPLIAVSQQAQLIQNFGHSNRIKAIDVSQDNKFTISGDGDGQVKIWDFELRRLLATFSTFDASITQVKILGQQKLAFASCQNTIFKWNLSTGDLETKYIVNKGLILDFVLIQNDNKILACCKNGEVKIFDIKTGNLEKSIMNPSKEKNVTNYSIGNQNILSYFSDNGWNNNTSGLQLWNYADNSQITTINIENRKFNYATLSSDGNYLLIAGNDEIDSNQKRIFVYALPNGKLLSEITVITGKIVNLDYDALTKILVCSIERYPATESEFSAIDITTKKQVWKKNFIADEICLLPPKGLVLYSSYSVLGLIDLRKGSIIGGYGYQFEFMDASAINYNKTIIALGKSGEIKLCKLITGKIQNHKLHVKIDKIVFSENDLYLGIISNENYMGKVLMYNMENRKVEKTYNYDQVISSMAFNKDGSLFALALGKSEEGEVRICKAATGETVFSYPVPKNKVNDIAFCNDEGKVAFVSEALSGVVEISSGKLIQNIPFKFRNQKITVAINSDQIIFTGGDSEKFGIMVWDSKSGKKVNNKYATLDQYAGSASLSPGLKNMAVITGFWFGSSLNDKELAVKVWDAKTGALQTVLENERGVDNVFFSASGDMIYTVNKYGYINYWDAKTYKKTATITTLRSDDWVASTPQGLFDGSDYGIKWLHFVKDLTVIPLESLYEQYYTPNLLNRLFEKELAFNENISVNEISRAPDIKIISSNNQTTITGQNLTISVKATDQGGGIDEVRLYHNGKLLDGTTRGFKSTGQNHEFTVMLTNGENRIKATAFNSQRTESIPDEIVVHYKAPEIVKPNMHILAVGINNYLNPKYNLNYAKNDADAFVKSLSVGASSLFGKVEVTTINDADATKTGILAAIEKIKLASKAEDVFVFYYAGHGVMSSGNVPEKPQFYLVPHDVTKMYEADEMLKKSGISATEIGEFSKTIKAQKQLFVIDACQSGGAMQTLAMRGAAEEKAIAQLARSTGTYFIAASGTEQFATEVAELGHGIFTYSVIEALKGSCKSQDGKITVNLLKSCVEDLVPELSKKHKGQPQFPTGYGFGMDFPVVIIK